MDIDRLNITYDRIYKEFCRIEALKPSGRTKGIQQLKAETLLFLQYMVEHFSRREVEHIKFIEIGVYIGKNFVITGNILNFLANNVHGIAIDPAVSEPLKKHKNGMRGAIERWQPTFSWEFIKGKSQSEKVLEKVGRDRRDIDLVFIDGGHEKEEAMQDFKLYWPMLKPGGIVAFHGVMNKAADKQGETWREILASKPCEAETFALFPHKIGIGIIIKGDKDEGE
jgi:hypothetical protein